MPGENNPLADGHATGQSITVTGTAQRQAWQDRLLAPVQKVRAGVWSVPTPFPDSPLAAAYERNDTSLEFVAHYRTALGELDAQDTRRALQPAAVC